MKSLDSIINEEVGLAVERIMRASREAALAVFDEHFARRLGRQPPHQQAILPRAATSAGSTRRRAAPRSTEEIVALEARFLAAVRSSPGQSMAKLAPQVGATPAELRVPVVRLKAKKQVKVVGQGRFSSYFPVDEDVAA
jgi:hypothetical protein